ncbi:TetR/AcrR family transcriptional regulator [Actinacidiphila oryziradicis]|uniref:TetR/AcrR family transcriptional regulator n=2 Tax=Actinacidiphila oryziradicis TaxID=2571141 RepID=A0A4U0R8K1_9ACTN|nr:TetR/AcrR family transcriptional regulator [Actinacidiphila oryziradicis]TJZ91136.1 TetR/AcrR family transcriptional regulator [Actinacidiphila oryziradicis]
MDLETARARVLDAAGELFYGRGVQAVGMDEIRSASGVSLKRLYQLFPSKGDLVEAYLRRRDARWRAALAGYVDARPAEVRVLAVFDWLYQWFGEDDFRGCGFINCFGELGATSAAVADVTLAHKEAFQEYLTGLVAASGGSPELAAHLALLAEGAMTTAAIAGSPEPARQARAAAVLLIEASRAVRAA